MLSGMILMWKGSIASVPSGFALCDGTNGTPDLRDKFLVGAGSTYGVNDNGGNINHNHAFTSAVHNHSIPNAASCPGAGASLCLAGTDTGDKAATGTTDNGDGRPPYYALAYIMKL